MIVIVAAALVVGFALPVRHRRRASAPHSVRSPRAASGPAARRSRCPPSSSLGHAALGFVASQVAMVPQARSSRWSSILGSAVWSLAQPIGVVITSILTVRAPRLLPVSAQMHRRAKEPSAQRARRHGSSNLAGRARDARATMSLADEAAVTVYARCRDSARAVLAVADRLFYRSICIHNWMRYLHRYRKPAARVH
ncbi:MAG TPA: hypothetical protein VFC31_05850 [Candidatus Limnocylindria bacterium]|nr:hypothetical protein [Candidatus Limnocylindria bacterium]